MAGDFAWTLTFTDIQNGWTQMPGHLEQGASRHSPVFTGRGRTIAVSVAGLRLRQFTRSRPYHKNDNAHVEQKNWSAVRQLLGYERLENPEVIALLNDLYENEWHWYVNYFCSTFKLLEKKKVGSKYVKRYEKPRTPYARLLDGSDGRSEREPAGDSIRIGSRQATEADRTKIAPHIRVEPKKTLGIATAGAPS
jgi:hypothetical protein